jgi:hypothetical protein
MWTRTAVAAIAFAAHLAIDVANDEECCDGQNDVNEYLLHKWQMENVKC